MRIVFAGGGTGGHLFPGIALAERARTHYPDADILFLCTSRQFDVTQLKKYGLTYYVMPSPRLAPTPRLPVELLYAVIQSIKVLRRHRVNGVLGLGGYGSFPTLVAARILGLPCAVLEQNALPGKVNRVAARWADRIYSQWDEARRYFHNSSRTFRFTGSPLRPSLKIFSRREAMAKLELDERRMTVTVMGGSQGAMALNAFMAAEMELLKAHKDRLQVIHLCGAPDMAVQLEKNYRSAGIPARVFSFTDRVDLILSASDLAISRAGGMAIAEIASYGVPALFVPYPHAAENHQWINARTLEKAGAAWVVTEDRLALGSLSRLVDRHVADRKELDEMKRMILLWARPESADIILNDFVSLVRRRGHGG